MNRKIFACVLACLMLFGCIGVCAAETDATAGVTETVTESTVTETTVTEGAVPEDTTTGASTETTPVVDTSAPDYTNLDPAKGDLVFRGTLLLNAEGGRAESIEAAANLPEGFYESSEYLAFLNPTPTPSIQVKPAVSPFPDVSVEHTNVAAIEDMKKRGYIVGYEDGTFRPDNHVSRAEFVKVLIEKDGGVGSVADAEVSGFSDVDGENPHWAQKYIILGVKKGYLAGMGDGTFAPDAAITYEQAMKILVCHFGKEVSAKTIASSKLPLWPNAYVLTGEQMNMHLKTGLSIGKQVNRAQFAQMLSNGITTVSRNVNSVISGGSSGGGVGGGSVGGGTNKKDDDSTRVTGVIVSTNGLLIDRNSTVPMITSPAFITLRYTDRESGEDRYIKLREPYDASNRGGSNMFKNYLGYEVTLRYTNEGDYFEIAKNSFKASDTTKKLVINAEDIDRSETLEAAANGLVAFYYRNERNLIKDVKLPESLDDMAVVYNGVTIDEAHPSYDHDFVNDDTYIKITDILPKNGTVTFINREGGPVELAIVETYETVVPKASPSMGIVTDKYDETKKFNLDPERLLPELNTHYGANREISASEVDVIISKKNSSGIYTEAQLYDIRAKTAVTIYASRDRTKVQVYISDAKIGGSTGAKVTQSFDEDEKTIKMASVSYKVSNYLINNVAAGYYEDKEDMRDIFPLNENVVAYQDKFGEIVDVEIKDPDYVYGYLVDIDYEESSNSGDAYFEMRIITKENVSKYSDPDAQTFKVKVGGKIKIDDTEYRYTDFDDAARALTASARIINYGTAGSGNSKPAEVLTHATFAQPIRFVRGSASNEIRIIKTMVPTLAYTDSDVWNDYQIGSSAYYIHDPANTSKKYLVGTNPVIFSVPDDRFDYDKYEIKPRSYLAAYKRCNPEIYPETTSTGSTVYNCVVLYDESITGRPTIESPIVVVKSIDYYDTIDGENVYKLVAYQPTSITAASEKTYYVAEGERTTVNTHARYETGDVIMFGTTKIGTLSAIKNVYHVVDISDRDKLGFSKKYERDGEESDDASPYYWYRYGTVIDFDSSSDTMLLDVGRDENGVDMIESLEGTGLFFSPTNSNTLSKPVYFYADGTEGEIAKGVTERFPIHNLGEMVQPGDMIFLFASGTSNYQKAIYLIPAVDRDQVHPKDMADITYADVTFNVATEGATVTMAGNTATVESGVAVIAGVEEGVYTYRVTKANHESKSGTIIIRNGITEYTVNDEEGNPIELVRITCGVRFIVQPGNATVTIEGVEAKTGTEEEFVEATIDFAGLDYDVEYNYTVEADGYRTEAGSFTVTSGGTNPEITVSLDAVFAEVTFTGLPAGATVTVGETEQVAGVDGTVVFADVLYGTAYSVTAVGYEASVGTVTLADISVSLIPTAGSGE